MKPGRAQLRALARRDPALGRALAELGPFPAFPEPRVARRSYFEYLSRAIVYQQLAGKAAATIWGRVRRLFPDQRPRAAALASIRDEELIGAGLSRQKRAALRDLAARTLAGELQLQRLGRLEDEQVVRLLTCVRGIGAWTVHMLLMHKLGRLDVMPSTDLGVLEGLRILDGLEQRPTPAAALERAELWRPLRTVGAWTMWRVCDRERARSTDGA